MVEEMTLGMREFGPVAKNVIHRLLIVKGGTKEFNGGMKGTRVDIQGCAVRQRHVQTRVPFRGLDWAGTAKGFWVREERDCKQT